MSNEINEKFQEMKEKWKEMQDKWIQEHADIVKYLEGLGYKKSKPFSDDMFFFQKDKVNFKVDLGEDIIDETLSVRDNLIINPRKLLDKYGISISSNTFYDTKIFRIINLWYEVNIRFSYKNHIGNMEIGCFFHSDSKSDAEMFELMRENEETIRDKDFTIQNISSFINKLEEKQKKLNNLIVSKIPNTIKELREFALTTKEKHKKAIETQKLINYLYGCVQQFDALHGN